uniref:Glutamate rich 5 n=1 Tax=Moschus moschiferus TaxID=68415 RepID=A0A8C6CJ11_MOSMO
KSINSSALSLLYITSNIYFSATEESESCFVQPKPRALGRESTLCGKVQKESLPPLDKLKISAVSTANGVQSLPEQPLAKEAADPPGATEETQPLQGLKGSEPSQPGGKDAAPGAEGKEEDVEAATEAPPLKGSAETEPLGAEAKNQPLITVGEGDSPGAVEGTEDPQAAGEMMPLGTAERVPLEAAREPGSQEAGGKGEQSQIPETVPKETESPEILEDSQPVETAETHQLQETFGEDEQSQLVETVPKENSQLPETIPRDQSVETAVKADSLHKTPEGPGNMQKIQPEKTVGSMEHPAGILETGAKVEMARKIHTNEEDQRIEGKSHAWLKVPVTQTKKASSLEQQALGFPAKVF